jgi:hypothetical protein
MDKKAQGLPISTIILAVLGLVVLVILFAIVTGRMAIFGRGISECQGTCKGEWSASGAQTSGVKSAVASTTCDSAFEKEIAGSYVRAGQPSSQKREDMVICSKCCVPIA